VRFRPPPSTGARRHRIEAWYLCSRSATFAPRCVTPIAIRLSRAADPLSLVQAVIRSQHAHPTPPIVSKPIDRILATLGEPGLVQDLAKLPGADLTTLLLETARSRAEDVTAAQLLRRYAEDRFTAPTGSDFHALRRVEDTALQCLPAGFEAVTLAPLVPFGTHRALGRTDQNRVVTTVRGQEVAADPTTALALEAASRRATALRLDRRSAGRVSLAASQRVVRAQRQSGARNFAHFALLGLVTAGRDTGSLEFERETLVDHLEFYARCLAACGAKRVTIELSDFADGAYASVLSTARERLRGFRDVEVVDAPERTRARGYYLGAALRITAESGGEPLDLADGGFVDWTQKLLGSAKERCLISGLGLERLALLSAAG
jgi:hypothetical protein